MKIKKILYVITIITLIFFIVMLSIKIFNSSKKDKTIILGNAIENIDTADTTFTSSFMTSTLLLKMLTNDASKESQGKLIKLSQLILNSNQIIINIGSVDLCNYIKEDNTLNYDETILIRQSEIIVSNINEIIKLVDRKSKNANINVYEISYPYSIKNEKLESIFKDINIKIKEIISRYKTNINNLSCFSFNKYNLLKNSEKTGIITLRSDKNGK